VCLWEGTKFPCAVHISECGWRLRSMCTEFFWWSSFIDVWWSRTNRVGFRKHMSPVCVYCSLHCDVSDLWLMFTQCYKVFKLCSTVQILMHSCLMRETPWRGQMYIIRKRVGQSKFYVYGIFRLYSFVMAVCWQQEERYGSDLKYQYCSGFLSVLELSIIWLHCVVSVDT
jgi:hypothetical protein